MRGRGRGREGDHEFSDCERSAVRVAQHHARVSAAHVDCHVVLELNLGY